MGDKIGKMLREKIGQLLDRVAEVLDKNKQQLAPQRVKSNPNGFNFR